MTKEQLFQLEKELSEAGYVKRGGHYKHENYAWWKSFAITYDTYGTKRIGYQIAVTVYDDGKFNKHKGEPIYLQFDFVTLLRFDISVCEEIMTVTKFEQICDFIYNHLNGGEIYRIINVD
jgi:hypothetical protein